MPWFRVDDDFHDHPKVVAAGPFGIGVWLLCGSWCAEKLTDGLVPASVVAEKGGKNWRRAADALVAAGLWEPVNHDREQNERTTREYRESLSRRDTTTAYRFHDYLDYNPSRADVLAERERNAARQRASRERRKATRHGVTSGRGKGQGRAAPNHDREDMSLRESQCPDPYVPTGRHGAVRAVRDTRSGDSEKQIFSIDEPQRLLVPPPDARRALDAALERAQEHGRRVRGATRRPPMDDHPRRSA